MSGLIETLKLKSENPNDSFSVEVCEALVSVMWELLKNEKLPDKKYLAKLEEYPTGKLFSNGFKKIMKSKKMDSFKQIITQKDFFQKLNAFRLVLIDVLRDHRTNWPDVYSNTLKLKKYSHVSNEAFLNSLEQRKYINNLSRYDTLQLLEVRYIFGKANEKWLE